MLTSPSQFTLNIEVYSGQQLLSIHLLPIRPVLCPMDLYQGDEASDGLVESMGHQDSDLPYNRFCFCFVLSGFVLFGFEVLNCANYVRGCVLAEFSSD